MRKLSRIAVGPLIVGAFIAGSPGTAMASQSRTGPAVSMIRPDADFGSIPLYFIPNRGQADSRALFSARAEGFTLWATRDGLIFDQQGRSVSLGACGPAQLSFGGAVTPGAYGPAQLSFGGAVTPGAYGPAQLSFGGAVTSLVFLGSRRDVEVSAEGPAAHRANFFLGRDPAQWRTNIPTSSAIRYNGLYPGIDLKVYGIGRRIEYDWVVAPGADPAAVRFRYERARATRLDPEGNLVVDSLAGSFTHKKPAAYQEIAGRRVAVACRYERLDADTYGFRVGRYDRRRPLVIDPLVIIWSSYLGGSRDDIVTCMAVDAEGAAVVAGTTDSTDFPLVSPIDSVLGGENDIFVAGIAPAGNALLYSTFIGGLESDVPYDLAIDAAGNPVVGGLTLSRNFPARNAYDSGYNGGYREGFLLRLSSSGDALKFSTYLGGRESDIIRRVVIDPSGAIVVAGSTTSTNFPVVKALKKTLGGRSDVFISKFSADGKSLLYSTYLGGKDNDLIDVNEGGAFGGLAVDAQGRIHVAGITSSPDFPVKNALYPVKAGKGDGFLTILTPNGRALEASTFIGGRGWEYFNCLAVDPAGFIYLGGETSSTDFPTRAAFDPVHNGEQDGVVLKLEPLAKKIVFSTYLGGKGVDRVAGLALDSTGGVIVAGRTESPNFPVKNALDGTLGGKWDAFVAKLQPSGKALVFSTYLGGGLYEDAWGLFADQAGAIYVCGMTTSKKFPCKLAFDAVYSGRQEGFVTKLRWR